MSYGMQIRTPNGLESVENLRSLREVFRFAATSSTGSVSIPNGAVESNSAVFFEINDGKFHPQLSWSGSTLSWGGWAFVEQSSDFTLIVCRFK